MNRVARRERGIRWGAATSLMSGASIALCSLFSVSISLNYLGKELYALWAIITSFFIWLQFFDLGLLSGLTNALTEAFGREDFSSAKSYISTSFFVSALISLIGIPLWIYFALQSPWDRWIHVTQSENLLLLSKGVCFMGVLFFLTLPFLIANRILQAYQKMYILNVLVFVGYLLSFCALCLGVYSHFSFLPLLISVCAIPYLCAAGVWIYLIQKMPWTRVSWHSVSRQAFRRICASSFPLLAYQMLNLITVQMIPLVLASKVDLKSVADFSILWKIFQFLLVMVAGLSTSYAAAVREAYERKEKSWIIRSIKRLLLFQAGIVALVSLPLISSGNQLIYLWTRQPFQQPLLSSQWLLFSLCLLFSVLSTTLATLLNSLEKIIPQCLLSLITCLLIWYVLQIGVATVGLMAIFQGLLLAYFISCLFSLKHLRKTLYA